MHLSLLLSILLPVYVLSCILHITQDTVVTKDQLGGFKHLEAAEFVKRMQQAGLNPDKTPTTLKYAYLCRYTYCHGKSTTAKCNEICFNIAEKYDRDIVNNRVKKLSDSKVPAAGLDVCRKECAVDCGKTDCKRE